MENPPSWIIIIGTPYSVLLFIAALTWYHLFVARLVNAGHDHIYRLSAKQVTKVKHHNKSKKLFRYLKLYPKGDIQNIHIRNPKHFLFLTQT